ncbi:hypothetical protein EKO27_g7676 [Xylaria grammica]|uniref:DUF7587 domain-containing protein n=1 Tax=Xylaria grammica TaxID=363999 RepID=A0A439CYY2_9PEZI|nr:hypothetical protein EKO27_g7676 [Xylaria grammica]
MGDSVNDVIPLFGGLAVSNDVPRDGVSPNRSSNPTTLYDLTQTLIESSEDTISNAKHVDPFLDDMESLGSIEIGEILLLRRGAVKLADAARILNETAARLNKALESSVITRLISLRSPESSPMCPDSQLLERLLTHFDEPIKRIIRCALDEPNMDDSIPWKVSEECYNQATRVGGTLCAQDYSEVEKQSWIGFWAGVLCRSPNGPTLFSPSASIFGSSDPELEEIPPYLFRVFDHRSSGKNSATVMASEASIRRAQDSRIDILSLDESTVTERLHYHLEQKSLVDAENFDNLISWTSSLLFALQYAIYRDYKFGIGTEYVKICVVDTRKFPRGQFVSDMRLIQRYRQTAEDIGGKPENFFRFRWTDERYYNGEYLSQGRVHLCGRSSVRSLKDLIQFGLYNLYSDLGEAEGRTLWPKRVLKIRERWNTERKTTRQELLTALIIARKFDTVPALDLAIVLLTLKNRKYKSTMLNGESCARLM